MLTSSRTSVHSRAHSRVHAHALAHARTLARTTDRRSRSPPLSPLLDESYHARLLNIAANAAVWQQGVLARALRLHTDVAFMNLVDGAADLQVGEARTHFFVHRLPGAPKASEYMRRKGGGPPSPSSPGGTTKHIRASGGRGTRDNRSSDNEADERDDGEEDGDEPWRAWLLDDPVVVKQIQSCAQGTRAEENMTPTTSTGIISGSSSADNNDIFLVTTSGALCRGRIGERSTRPVAAFLNRQILYHETVLSVCCGA
jgi:hypothetical protein